MARPEAEIDWEKVDELLISGCLGTELASFFGVHPNTFYRRVEDYYNVSFSEYSQQKRSTGEALLRHHQFQKALGITKKGDNTLLIWLGKNRLGQKESHEEKQSPKQEDMDLKQQYYASEYELQKLKEKLYDSQCKTGEELQPSDTSI